MKKLISINDIREFKNVPISDNAEERINECIDEAQEFDMMPIFGDELWIALENDFTFPATWGTQIYNDLFNGKTYTYQSRTYRHRGIKALLCYATWARYKADSNVTTTEFGTVEKISDQSNYVADKILQRQIAQAQSGAEKFKQDVIDFLNRNETTYPLWRNRINCENKSLGMAKISGIGGNSKQKLASSYCCPNCRKYTNCICNPY